MAESLLTYALTTVARVKARLKIDVADHDTVLLGYINGVTDFIETLCGGRRFKKQTITHELHSVEPGQSMIFLKQGPVASVSAFEYNAGTKSSPNWTAFQDDIWYLEGDGKAGIIEVDGVMPSGTNIVRVTYVAGYEINFSNFGDMSTHTLPADLTDLAERLVTRRWKKRENEGQQSSGVQSSTISWQALLDDEDKAIIAAYRRDRFL